MAFGAASGKHSKPIRSKPAKAYNLRPAVPRVSGGGKNSSGKATMQIRVAAAALVAVPMAVMALLVTYLVVNA